MKQRVLVIGSGGRERAIAEKLRQSPCVASVDIGPALLHGYDLVFLGSENAVAEGAADLVKIQRGRVFGPTKAAAKIETSKLWAKKVMEVAGVPHAQLMECGPVVKADGLMGGKGTFFCESINESLERQSYLEAQGQVAFSEERLYGQEVSVFTFTDGVNLTPCFAAVDYKRAYDGDWGPMTGGMGAYAPPFFWTADLEREIRDTIMRPTVDALRKMGHLYQGVLYAGIMLTDDGPKVLEFNARLGDPEAQALLPLLKTDLMDVVDAVLEYRVKGLTLEWSTDTAVAVVLVPRGYPAEGHRGATAVGIAPSRDEAQMAAYREVWRLAGPNDWYREDIGA